MGWGRGRWVEAGVAGLKPGPGAEAGVGGLRPEPVV